VLVTRREADTSCKQQVLHICNAAAVLLTNVTRAELMFNMQLLEPLFHSTCCLQSQLLSESR
jgi:hypothetical protein